MSALVNNAIFPFVMVALIIGVSVYQFRKNGGKPGTGGHDGNDGWTDGGSDGGDGGD